MPLPPRRHRSRAAGRARAAGPPPEHGAGIVLTIAGVLLSAQLSPP